MEAVGRVVRTPRIRVVKDCPSTETERMGR
jgi:hypothetical protein